MLKFRPFAEQNSFLREICFTHIFEQKTRRASQSRWDEIQKDGGLFLDFVPILHFINFAYNLKNIYAKFKKN